MAEPDFFELMEDVETEDGRSRTAVRVYSCAYADRYGSWVPKPFITPYEPGDSRICVRVSRKGVGIGDSPVGDGRYPRCRVECQFSSGAFPGAAAQEEFEPCSELLQVGGYRKFLSTNTIIDIPNVVPVHYERYVYSRTIDYNQQIHRQIRRSEGTINSRFCNKGDGYAPGTMLMEGAKIRKYQNPETLIWLMDVQLCFKLLPSNMGTTWNHVWNADLPGWDDSLEVPVYQYSDFTFFRNI